MGLQPAGMDWTKFCGMELRWNGDGDLHVAQPSYIAELIKRYLYGTKELGLMYGGCKGDRGPDGGLPFARSMRRLKMYADISFAPMGEKSHQGVLGFYGGALVQWESSRQPFATLSTAEAELVGYIEAMIMGDSLCAVLDTWRVATTAEESRRK